MAPTYTAKMRVQYSIHWSWFYGWQPLSARWEQTTLQRAQLAGFHRRIAGATFAKKTPSTQATLPPHRAITDRWNPISDCAWMVVTRWMSCGVNTPIVKNDVRNHRAGTKRARDVARSELARHLAKAEPARHV